MQPTTISATTTRDIYGDFHDTQEIALHVEQQSKLTYVCRLHQQADITLDLTAAWTGAEIHCHVLVVAHQTSTPKLRLQGILAADETTIHVRIVTLLWEQGKADVDGGIVIKPDIIKASGHLLEENVLLGEKVQLHVIPKLDVHSNDVSASHGAKIHRLDPHKLFYLHAKWLDHETAKKTMLEGTIRDLLAPLEDDNQKEQRVQETLHQLLQA